MMRTGAGPFVDALKACRRHVVTAAAFGLALNILHLAGPLYMMQVYDRVLASGSGVTLAMLTLAVLLAYAALAGLDRARGEVMAAASLRAERLLSGRAFASMLRNASSPGKGGGQALRDLESCRQLATSPAVAALFDAPWIPVYVLVIFGLHWALGLFTLVCAGSLIGLAVLSEFGVRELAREAHAGAASSHAWAEAGVRNGDAVRAMGLMPDLVRHWSARRGAVVSLQHRLAARTSTLAAVVRFLRLAMQSLVLGLGAWLAIEHAISPGAIFAASLLLGRALQPVEQVIGQWQAMVGARAAMGRLEACLGAAVPHSHQATVAPSPVAQFGGEDGSGLVVENLGYVLAERPTPLLSNVSFRISRGECVGLIGPSGAGKTTLVRLVVGAAAPTTGTIGIDGIALDELTGRQGHATIGYLPQDVQLFDDTVAANIARFSKVAAPEVIAAARIAGAHDLIIGLPQGYLTRIGEAGRILSGGMRQRIGLARAVFGNPRLVVLDEPSANLDGAGHTALTGCIRHLVASGTTVILVSHRRECTALMSRFLVLVAGRLVAAGSREEVVRRMTAATSTADAQGAEVPIRSGWRS